LNIRATGAVIFSCRLLAPASACFWLRNLLCCHWQRIVSRRARSLRRFPSLKSDPPSSKLRRGPARSPHPRGFFFAAQAEPLLWQCGMLRRPIRVLRNLGCVASALLLGSRSTIWAPYSCVGDDFINKYNIAMQFHNGFAIFRLDLFAYIFDGCMVPP